MDLCDQYYISKLEDEYIIWINKIKNKSELSKIYIQYCNKYLQKTKRIDIKVHDLLIRTNSNSEIDELEEKRREVYLHYKHRMSQRMHKLYKKETNPFEKRYIKEWKQDDEGMFYQVLVHGDFEN